MTDKDLLERAARAAGINFVWGFRFQPSSGRVPAAATPHDQLSWNPLTDDGDAFRLAVKLGIHLSFGANYVIADGAVQQPTVNNANDPYAATRRAIVRAAAATDGLGV